MARTGRMRPLVERSGVEPDCGPVPRSIREGPAEPSCTLGIVLPHNSQVPFPDIAQRGHRVTTGAAHRTRTGTISLEG